jgi:nucleoside-diphosphate-sugar epimerase
MARQKTMLKILVTGGTGFLGKRLVRTLLARGDSVRVLGRNACVCAELASFGARDIVRADLRDGDAVRRACAGMDVVCHAGALSAPWGPRAQFHAVNVGGTAHVIAGCRDHNVRRLVYVSSPSVVFNGQDQTGLPDDAPYPRRFASVYSETKKLGEDLVGTARNDLETVIIRPKAIFGPGDTSLLPRLLNAAARGRLPQIGDGANRIDLTYVDNVVHALSLSLESHAAVGNTYTITGGESVRLWDVVRTLLGRLGYRNELRRVPLRTAYAVAALLEAASRVTGREPLLTRYTVAVLARTQTYDISAARRDLDYAPLVSVTEGLEHTVAALLRGQPSRESVA